MQADGTLPVKHLSYPNPPTLTSRFPPVQPSLSRFIEPYKFLDALEGSRL